MTLITEANFAATLKESTTARGSTPNGNVFFDVANNRIQLIGVNELATVDFGGGPVTNPLNNFDGITMRALYNFENARRRVNETLRKYKRGTDGDYRFAGAFNFVNGVKLDSNDRNKLRGSGWQEFADSGDGQTAKDRIYHGVRSLVPIQGTTTPFWTLVTATNNTTLQAATWADFIRAGAIDEAVQVFGTTGNTPSDAGAGNFDYTLRILVVRVRSWQYNPGETTSVASGMSELGGFSAGYGVGETSNPSNAYTLANVYGGAKISPWTGMSLERLAVSQSETGFNEVNGNFKWVLNNTASGTAQQCAAYLDAVTLQNADVDDGSGTYNGQKGRVWYSRNASGKIVTFSIGGEGLFIEGLSVAEKQNVIFTDDAAATKTYPFFPELQITVGAVAISDVNAWYHVYYVDGSGAQDFDTANAVTVTDSSSNPIKGNVAADQVGGKISRGYSYDVSSEAGLTPGTDKAMVVLVEGNGVAGQAITYFTMTRTTTVAVTAAPPIDTNA